VRSLLDSHSATAGLVLIEGWPEFVTALPERGEGRNHDLLLSGSHGGSGVVVSIEAKVDEQYGECIGDYWQRAHNSMKPTRAPERIEALLSIVFGANARPDTEPWSTLRYQLLTAVSGTAIEAARREVGKAVVIVHEILTESADAIKVARNAQDFSDFVSALLSRGEDPVQPGHLYGPVVLAANKDLSRPISLFIGKAVFIWQNNHGRPIIRRLGRD
jgi:hypothetical protein